MKTSGQYYQILNLLRVAAQGRSGCGLEPSLIASTCGARRRDAGEPACGAPRDSGAIQLRSAAFTDSGFPASRPAAIQGRLIIRSVSSDAGWLDPDETHPLRIRRAPRQPGQAPAALQELTWRDPAGSVCRAASVGQGPAPVPTQLHKFARPAQGRSNPSVSSARPTRFPPPGRIYAMYSNQHKNWRLFEP